MQFTIETTEEKLKKHFEKDYNALAILSLVMYTIIIVTLCAGFLFDNFWLVLKYYLLGMGLLAVLLFFLVKLVTKVSLYMLSHVVDYKYGKFTEIINEDGITEVLDEDASTLKWEEVAKVITGHKFIIVKPKNKREISFLFKKSHFDTEEEYQKVVKTIQKYYQNYQKKGTKK